MIRTIEVENVGPITRLTIPLPESGVVILRGPNGSGKTETLHALSRLTGGKDALTVRDGERQGVVRFGECKLTVGRTTRRTGIDELEVHSLEGRFDVGKFCDPGIEDPAAADAKRIKMLVSLSGQPANAAIFHDLMGGPESFKTVVPPEDLETEDVVLLAARVKRRLEAEARTAEGQAENADRDAHGFRAQAEGVNLQAECDGTKLQDALTRAVRTESDLQAKAENAERTRAAAETARAKLAEVEGSNEGPTVAGAALECQSADAAVVEAQKRAIEAEAALKAARAAVNQATDRAQAARAGLQAAKQHVALVGVWREQIEAAAAMEPVPESALESAAYGVAKARRAVEQGAIIRAAREATQKAEAAEVRAKEHRRRAEERRSQAAGVDDVLSGLVAKFCERVKVYGGRLVTQTGRGRTFFGELSTGEKRHLALDVAIDVVGEGGLLTMDEWPTLDPVAKRDVAEHLTRRRAILVAAEATAEELHAEVFGDEQDKIA